MLSAEIMIDSISALHSSQHQSGGSADCAAAGHLPRLLHPHHDWSPHRGHRGHWSHPHQPSHQWSHLCCYCHIQHRSVKLYFEGNCPSWWLVHLPAKNWKNSFIFASKFEFYLITHWIQPLKWLMKKFQSSPAEFRQLNEILNWGGETCSICLCLRHNLILHNRHNRQCGVLLKQRGFINGRISGVRVRRETKQFITFTREYIYAVMDQVTSLS